MLNTPDIICYTFTNDPLEYLDNDEDIVWTDERIFKPCPCCKRSMVHNMPCLTCTDTKEKETKHHINIFMVTMIITAIVTCFTY